MKKIFLVVLVIFVTKAFAQFSGGEPYNFCTLSNVIYNPAAHGSSDDIQNMWVVTIPNDNYTKSEKAFLQSHFEEEHPNHTIIGEATPTYNCHGYSFGIYQGTIPCKIKWFEEFCNDAFIEITDTNAIQYGDIAVVRKYTDYGHTILDYESEHSSIVVNQDTLISKWGEGPLTKHHKYDLINIDGFDNGSTVYTYYRRVANTEIYGPDTFNGNGSYTFVPNVTPSSCRWNIEPYTMFQQSFSFGQTASLSYKSNLTHISPKSVITFTFQYGCDNSYTTKREIELEIPTSTLSGTITSDGFIVGDNAVVTVTGEIRMEENSKIIIKPGGKLIVDGGLLTSACSSTKWQGIQVWGIDSLHQNTINGHCLQGFLEMKNGATIENAVCAVDLWNPLDDHSEGGVIQATDAVFRNNAKAVRALNYSNYNQNTGKEKQGISYMRRCSFVIDTNYFGKETFYNHVELDNIDGFKFYNCSFSADRNVKQLASSTNAIYANGAGFSVDNECSTLLTPCPEDKMLRSTFDGFKTAVFVTGSGSSARTFTICGAEFSNNGTGVYATNTGYAKIIKSNFYVGSSASTNYGIYIKSVTSFCIEENTFTSTKKPYSYGVLVQDSPSYNEIYLNHFYNMYYGNIASGLNMSTSDPTLGLTYTCNTNEGNTNDIGVILNNRQAYVSSSQGSATLAAANTFSATNYHFYNEGTSLIKYYYKGTGNKMPTRVYRVTRVSASTDHECKSHYDQVIGGGGDATVMSVEETDSLKSLYASYLNSYNSISTLGIGKIVKESDMAAQESQADMFMRRCLMAAGDIVRNNLNKEERDFTELREWLGKSDDILSARMTIASYIQQKDFVNALSLAKTLPAKYGLEGEELKEHNDYVEIIRIHESLDETGRSALQLSDYEMSVVKGIADNGSGAAQSMAQAIIAEKTGIPADFMPISPTIPQYGMLRESAESDIDNDEETAFSVTLSPNPTDNIVNVAYTLPEDELKASLVMHNALGISVMTATLDGHSGMMTLDISELPSGIYFYTVSCSEDVRTGKLIVK